MVLSYGIYAKIKMDDAAWMKQKSAVHIMCGSR